MFKRDVIKKLHALGVRKVEKPGFGDVSLGHIKTATLCAILWNLEHKENQ